MVLKENALRRATTRMSSPRFPTALWSDDILVIAWMPTITSMKSPATGNALRRATTRMSSLRFPTAHRSDDILVIAGMPTLT
ncbi:MAG: hypothetical protein K2K22_05535, partial [Muribaculaceae bacterium]|nr:hypothetical protein [Muribaculaceae bacterium]